MKKDVSNEMRQSIKYRNEHRILKKKHWLFICFWLSNDQLSMIINKIQINWKYLAKIVEKDFIRSL